MKYLLLFLFSTSLIAEPNLVGRLAGVKDGSSAAAGDVGEYLEDSDQTISITVADQTDQSISSLTLTKGEWEVRGGCNTQAAGLKVYFVETSITGTSTNTTRIGGKNQAYDAKNTGAGFLLDAGTADYVSQSIAPFQAVITAASETYTLKHKIKRDAGTAPFATVYCYMSARRVR